MPAGLLTGRDSFEASPGKQLAMVSASDAESSAPPQLQVGAARHSPRPAGQEAACERTMLAELKQVARQLLVLLQPVHLAGSRWQEAGHRPPRSMQGPHGAHAAPLQVRVLRGSGLHSGRQLRPRESRRLNSRGGSPASHSGSIALQRRSSAAGMPSTRGRAEGFGATVAQRLLAVQVPHSSVLLLPRELPKRGDRASHAVPAHVTRTRVVGRDETCLPCRSCAAVALCQAHAFTLAHNIRTYDMRCITSSLQSWPPLTGALCTAHHSAQYCPSGPPEKQHMPCDRTKLDDQRGG